MKLHWKLKLRALAFVGGSAALAASASAQALNSGTATVTLNATLAESLTVTATPANVNFALIAGAVAQGNAPVVITTTWVLGAGRSSVALDGYFNSVTAALSTTTTPTLSIPSIEVLGQDTAGTPTNFTPFSQTAALGTAGAGLLIFTQGITDANRSSNRSDNLNLEIDLTNQKQLPAAAYTGTLTLQAQAL